MSRNLLAQIQFVVFSPDIQEMFAFREQAPVDS